MITIYFEVIDYEYIWFAKRSLGKREKNHMYTKGHLERGKSM